MRKVCVLLLLLGCAVGSAGQSGPFGFEKGMTRAQIVALVGPKAVDPRVKGDAMRLNRAPQPEEGFQEFLLVISPTEGLLRVLGLGKLMQASDDGKELKDAYYGLVADLTKRFGEPASKTDACERGGAPACI